MTGQNSAPTLEDLVIEMNQMRTELSALRTKTKALTQNETITQPQTTVTTTRRMTLKRLGLALIGGAAAATALGASPSAEAKVSANPQGNGLTDKAGMLVVPPGAPAPSGTAPAFKYGLIACGNTGQALNLDNLTGVNFNMGLVGFGSGDSQSGVGVFGKGSTGVRGDGFSNGVTGNATNNFGIGVYGTSTGVDSSGVSGSGEGRGVYGFSDSGIGVQARSDHGAPLRIVAGSQPTAGTPAIGDIYVDASGNMHIYTGASWRQVAFL